ncbi:Pyridoxal phosphate-dependent transferase major region subdomain 2 [Penicillium atrosanguineum]|nr:Pyridoxal phosphate-dependent transferase major region subdomain 2 [Penicillium atrosanguineum]
MSKALNSHTSIKPEDVFVADCPTSMGSMLGFNLAAPGEGILVNRPVYGRFELDYGIEAGVEIVYADTDTEVAFMPDIVEKYEQALADAKERGVIIRAVLLVNPHNPVGKFFTLLKTCWSYGMIRRSSRVQTRSLLSGQDVEAYRPIL